MSKIKSVPLVRGYAAKPAPVQAIDLGALQAEFVAAGKALKSATTVHERARDAMDAASARQKSAAAKLAEASRTVLASA